MYMNILNDLYEIILDAKKEYNVVIKSLYFRVEVGNPRPTGHIRPVKSIGLALPRQPHTEFEIQ